MYKSQNDYAEGRRQTRKKEYVLHDSIYKSLENETCTVASADQRLSGNGTRQEGVITKENEKLLWGGVWP